MVLDVAAVLARFWGLTDARLTPVTGGMNSETWLVEHEEATYVAKRVEPHRVADLAAGCQVAAALGRAGIVTGAPVPTTDGSLLVPANGLALLTYVPGRELDGESDEEQEWMACTLAAVHRASASDAVTTSEPFMAEWLDPDQPGVAARPWLVRAIDSVAAEVAALDVTWAVVHTDPAPEAFRRDDRTDVTGLVDWAGARRGPALYDVASAVMYLGGRQHATSFLDAYTAHGAVRSAELEHLDAFSRFRQVIQAAYFARRVDANDLTGAIDPSENVKGLDDARRRLDHLGVTTT